MLLRIGKILLNSNVMLAPMAGVTDLPFRNMVAYFNPDILSFSEMVSSEALVRGNKRTLKMLQSNNIIQAIQIAGSNAKTMSESAIINEAYGADIIDINMGCPAKKIVNNYAGSWLMRDTQLAIDIIKSVINSVKIPVTLKMRLGWDQNSLNAPIIAKAAEELGIAMITIHGRTRSQMYSGNADWHAIEKIKNSVQSIPIICNGDITSTETAISALEQSKCAGVMIGRGAIGKPWILNKIHCAINNDNKFSTLDVPKLLELIKMHMSMSLEFHGANQGVKNFRKHLLAYTKSFPNSSKFRNEILSQENPNDIVKNTEIFLREHNSHVFDK